MREGSPNSGFEPLLSPDEVASLCGYSRKAIYGAIERGELRATKRCSRWRISVDDLRAWLEEGVPAPASREAAPRRRALPPAPLARGSFRALVASEEKQQS
jgi:excisionase family DNA binding protein